MAGMEALGRLLNIIPVASGQPFKIRGCSGVTVVAWNGTATTTTTVTLTQDSTFGGSFATAAAFIKNIYWTTANNGTAAWNKLTYVSGTSPFTSGPLSTFTFNNTGQTLATATCVAFDIFTSEFSDPNDYLKVTMTGSGGVCAVIPHDLVTQRAPANLEILAS